MKQQTPTIITTIGTDGNYTSLGTYIDNKGTAQQWKMQGTGLNLIIGLIDDLRINQDIECRHIVQRLA